MDLLVQRTRLKSRYIATLTVSHEEEIREAQDRIRSWAATRGFPAGPALSWVLPSDEEGSIEVRVQVSTNADVHPDIGIGLKTAPARYVAMVSVRDATVAPVQVAERLFDWVSRSGYEQVGPAEVFAAYDDSRNFDLSIPIKRRRQTDFIVV